MESAKARFQKGLGEKMPDLRRYARRLTGNASDAEDLLQDTCMRAIVNWHRFQEGTNLRAWLYTIMRNLHINSYRRPARHEVAFAPEDLAVVSPARPPAQESVVEFQDFLKAFGKLSPGRKKAIMLVGWDGMSYDDAAAKLGVPTGTVRSQLSRAREELRDALQAPGGEGYPLPQRHDYPTQRAPAKLAHTPAPVLESPKPYRTPVPKTPLVVPPKPDLVVYGMSYLRQSVKRILYGTERAIITTFVLVQ